MLSVKNVQVHFEAEELLKLLVNELNLGGEVITGLIPLLRTNIKDIMAEDKDNSNAHETFIVSGDIASIQCRAAIFIGELASIDSNFAEMIVHHGTINGLVHGIMNISNLEAQKACATTLRFLCKTIPLAVDMSYDLLGETITQQLIDVRSDRIGSMIYKTFNTI